MRVLGIIALCVVLLIGGGVVWYKLAYPTYTFRYRMTVEVLVDGVLHSGSSVIEVQLERQPRLLASNPVFPRVDGEATFVDLGKGQNIVSLLASGQHAMNPDYPVYLVPQHFRLSIVKDSDLAALPKLQGKWELTNDRLPAFVTFKNLAEPNTAVVLSADEFDQVLGAKTRLKRILVELTRDAVTRNIQSQLPWLSAHKGTFGGSFDPTRSRPSQNLTGSEFIRRP